MVTSEYVWICEPRHDIYSSVVCATSKCSEQPAHMHDWSEPLLVARLFMLVKLLTEHHLEFLSLKGGCTGTSEYTFVKMSHCWKSQVTTHVLFSVALEISLDYFT